VEGGPVNNSANITEEMCALSLNTGVDAAELSENNQGQVGLASTPLVSTPLRTLP